MPRIIPQDSQELEELVIHLATLYDQGLECVDFDGEEVSNEDYDAMVSKLKQVLPDSEAFAPGTTSPSKHTPSGKLVQHHPPITSIDKADGDLDKKKARHARWVQKECAPLGYDLTKNTNTCFVQSYKHDGVAIRIYYKKGKLDRAGLRPRDGVNGTDVTENIRYVRGVPDQLPLPLTLAIGGELECLADDFTKVNDALKKSGEKLRENPRNHTFGAINQDDSKKTKEGRVSFTGYNITGFDDSHKYYKTEVERAKWCNQVLKVPFVQVRVHPVWLENGEICQESYGDLQQMEDFIPELPYEVDGVVLKVNNLEDQEQLGHHGGDSTKEPVGALAWKFAEESAITRVKEIEWNASRTGKIAPVAIFETPVRLAGTTVSRATCSNVGWLQRNGIGKGTEVRVIKAGKIIPKVIEVISGATKTEQSPTKCPSCKFTLQIVKGQGDNRDLMCQNLACGAKHVASMVFYLTMFGAKNLGESGMELLIQHGKVQELSDLYTLTVQDFLDSGFSPRESLISLAAIHMLHPSKDDDKLTKDIIAAKGQKKEIPAWQFFAALGIPGAGQDRR